MLLPAIFVVGLLIQEAETSTSLSQGRVAGGADKLAAKIAYALVLPRKYLGRPPLMSKEALDGAVHGPSSTQHACYDLEILEAPTTLALIRNKSKTKPAQQFVSVTRFIRIREATRFDEQ